MNLSVSLQSKDSSCKGCRRKLITVPQRDFYSKIKIWCFSGPNAGNSFVAVLGNFSGRAI